MIHWADDFRNFIRGRFPELGGEPVYIRTSDEVDTDFPAAAWGFTAVSLDQHIRETLSARGQWQGRGFATVVNPKEFFRLAWPEQLGLILHELSHHFENRPRILTESDAVQGRFSFDWATLFDASGDWLPDALPTMHGPRFVRAALHVFHRCRWDVSLGSMLVFADEYRTPDVAEVFRVLGEELNSGGNILDAVRKPLPSAFMELWS